MEFETYYNMKFSNIIFLAFLMNLSYQACLESATLEKLGFAAKAIQAA